MDSTPLRSYKSRIEGKNADVDVYQKGSRRVVGDEDLRTVAAALEAQAVAELDQSQPRTGGGRSRCAQTAALG